MPACAPRYEGSGYTVRSPVSQPASHLPPRLPEGNLTDDFVSTAATAPTSKEPSLSFARLSNCVTRPFTVLAHRELLPTFVSAHERTSHRRRWMVRPRISAKSRASFSACLKINVPSSIRNECLYSTIWLASHLVIWNACREGSVRWWAYGPNYSLLDRNNCLMIARKRGDASVGCVCLFWPSGG